MIPHIMWARSSHGEPVSPFLRGKKERPLKITFHTSSLAGASGEEAEAVEALRELSNHSKIESLYTEAGSIPYLEIGPYGDNDDHIPVTVTCHDRTIESGIPFSHQWSDIATKFAGQTDPSHPDSQAALTDLVLAQAHSHLRNDILITLSHHLLSHRTQAIIRKANPRTPTEAVKIIGLFLRSRDDYTWQVNEHGRRAFDRGLFYWVLVRHRLPNIWKYFSACVHAANARRDDTLHLGQSILTRCVRALEARDAIGAQFYIPQNNDTRDAIMYHFDYLTLLLAGVFDAQARIAHRAYRITRPEERYTGFRRAEFLKALTDNGADRLHALVSDQHFSNLMILLHELRNTIHGASLQTYQATSELRESLVTLFTENQDKIWQAAARYSSTEAWGLVRKQEPQLEPYTYAVTLTNECFSHIDAIAAATNVAGLFPDGYAIPPLQADPPDNHVFNENIRRRLAVLG
jgi:hypothetical protein